MPIEWLERSGLRWTGVMLLLLSLVWTVVAQAQMGESLRIGIDQTHRTNLVQSGVFKLSRNPIFLGMMVTLFGLFLVSPNALTLLTLAIGVVLIQIQVRLEEEFLARLHGDEFVTS
jgi:protein-S-isoprenylcysteine O-methyltransferase Ste14